MTSTASSDPFRTLSAEQITAYLNEPRHAILATNRRDGAPQLSPVWYLYEAPRVYFSLYQGSAKYHNLTRDSRVALCVDAGHPDARAVTIYGHCELHPADADPASRALLERLLRRYLDDDDVARYLAQTRLAGTLLLASVTPDKIIARDYN